MIADDNLSEEFTRELARRIPLHDPAQPMEAALAAEFRKQLPERLCRSYSSERSARALAALQQEALDQVTKKLDLNLLVLLPESLEYLCFDWIQINGIAYPSLGIVYTETAILMLPGYAEQRTQLFNIIYERLGFKCIVIVGCDGMDAAKFDGEEWILETLSRIG